MVGVLPSALQAVWQSRRGRLPAAHLWQLPHADIVLEAEVAQPAERAEPGRHAGRAELVGSQQQRAQPHQALQLKRLAVRFGLGGWVGEIDQSSGG